MRLALPQKTDVIIDQTDLDAATPHHPSEFACELCPVSRALMRTLHCAVALVGFDGAILFRTPTPNPFRKADDGHGARYRWTAPGLADLITAYDAGAFDSVRALLPFRFTIERIAE